ncbi:MAG TPA: hypothetical protein VFW15_06595 [Thermoanaerobaculia bacterium]|nr:hypothetical protein [Thermoanaerobaculia bacterium]
MSLELVERYSKVNGSGIRRTLAKMPPPFAECNVSAPTPIALPWG